METSKRWDSLCYMYNYIASYFVNVNDNVPVVAKFLFLLL